MSQVEHLELDDLLALVRALGTGPVRDVGLLDSAAARPQATAFGEPAYPTLSLQAAALLHSLVGNHALVDGNKRLGWLATVVFLDLNAHEPELSDDAAFQLVMDVAAGSAEVEEIAERLRVRSR
ncbi:type II toxin-antitoxin system death-on-curing family toxin [Modestobacter sp. VKM Ac-2984]|uniref:type II toxin-antitoxin system death-on-curing family toxin n=1 Tax=Modestobacter sp. VKM Ac-2984 TaxID=3004138 RepID=UPI0022AA9802|nr:Fic family protein [Modestobacter sp. VKM Ac-2984]MCZ2817903.1 Fic family protein [Modestobacter sp. VKM Ac-2984]